MFTGITDKNRRDKMVTKEEMLKHKKQYIEDIKEAISNNKILFDSRKTTGYDMKFMRSNRIESENLCGLDAQSSIKVILDFNNEVDELEFGVQGCEGKIEESSESCEDVDEFAFRYTYYTCRELTESQIEKEAMRRVKTLLTSKLQPKTSKYARHIDCGLFKIFIAGNLDFKTLQSIVYANCAI